MCVFLIQLSHGELQSDHAALHGICFKNIIQDQVFILITQFQVQAASLNVAPRDRVFLYFYDPIENLIPLAFV